VAKELQSIAVFGQTYRIHMRKASDFKKESDTCDGRVDTALCIIEIRDDATPAAQQRILCHEINHIILEWTRLGPNSSRPSSKRQSATRCTSGAR